MALPWQSRDARLVEEVRRGKPEAFEQIYARHQPAILSFCRHLIGQREDAEDAVQHTFLSAYCQIAESDGTLELRPWLFTVARNRCLSLLRARSARGTVALDDADQATDGLAIEVEQRQELRELVGDLSRLPEQQRAALLLAQLDDMSHREIGVVLDVAPAKVKALVFQARTSLASTREAREASCSDIRSQLATSQGSALRRRKLRRHVHECDGCRSFESVVLSQRRDLALLLPVAPSIGLREAILAAIPGRDAGALGGAGGAAATTVASGGATGGGFVGSLATIGSQGAAKLVAAGVVAVGGTGAVAADLPVHIQHGASPPEVAAAPHAPGSSVDGATGVEGSGPIELPQAPVEQALPPAFEPPRPALVPHPPANLGADEDGGSGQHGQSADRQADEPVSEQASAVPVEDEPARPPAAANGHSPPGPATPKSSPPGTTKKDPPPGYAPPGLGESPTDAPSPRQESERPPSSGGTGHVGDRGSERGNGGNGGNGNPDHGGGGQAATPPNDPHAKGGNGNGNAKGGLPAAKGGNGNGSGDGNRDGKGGAPDVKGGNGNAKKGASEVKGRNGNGNGKGGPPAAKGGNGNAKGGPPDEKGGNGNAKGGPPGEKGGDGKGGPPGVKGGNGNAKGGAPDAKAGSGGNGSGTKARGNGNGTNGGDAKAHGSGDENGNGSKVGGSNPVAATGKGSSGGGKADGAKVAGGAGSGRSDSGGSTSSGGGKASGGGGVGGNDGSSGGGKDNGGNDSGGSDSSGGKGGGSGGGGAATRGGKR